MSDTVGKRVQPEGRVARRRAKTRADLLAAAIDIFAEVGVEHATIAALTERADVSVGSFYLHFKDKDELIDVLLTEGIDAIRGQIFAELAALPSGTPLLPAMVRGLLRAAFDHRKLFALLLAGKIDRPLLARQRLAEQLTRVLWERRADLPGFDPAVLARLLAGVLLQAGLWWQDNDSPEPAEIERQVLLLLRHGLPASVIGTD